MPITLYDAHGYIQVRVVCGRGRNPTVRVFTLNVGRHLATGILRSG